MTHKKRMRRILITKRAWTVATHPAPSPPGHATGHKPRVAESRLFTDSSNTPVRSNLYNEQ